MVPSDRYEGFLPAIGSNNIIHVGVWDKTLYSINPDGTTEWGFSPKNEPFTREPFFDPTIGHDGTIYVGCRDGNLYAVYSSSKGSIDSPWPMFNHDAKHSGRAGGP